METPTILRAAAVGPYKVEIAWLGGRTETLDLEHVVMTRPEYRGIKSLVKFKDLAVKDDGKRLSWELGGVDMSSLNLWDISNR